MLLDLNNTKINIKCQQYSCSKFRFEKNNTELWLDFCSTQETAKVCCQYCGERTVDIHDNYTTTLIDMPLWADIKQYVSVTYHKYKCRSCCRVFNEDICFKDPDARVTNRASIWVQALLKYGLCISSVVSLTGINWYRYGHKSPIIASQLDPEEWHRNFGASLLADSILDRIVSNSYKIILSGDSLRPKNIVD